MALLLGLEHDNEYDPRVRDELEQLVAAIQTAFNGISQNIFSLEWADWAPQSTILGWASFTPNRKYIMYSRLGNKAFIDFHLEGTSNSTAVSFTLPYISAGANGDANGPYPPFTAALGFQYDNGGYPAAQGRITLSAGSNFVDIPLGTNVATAGWTAAGTKIAAGQFWYQVAT